MDHRTDQELLEAYAHAGNEVAFSALVGRYVDLVYSVALRIVCDAHLAEDVSQRVFVAMARSAPSLSQLAILAGWLHRTTHHISANTVRAEVRRRNREREAAATNILMTSSSEPSWSTVAPQLDEFLGELPEPDRDVLVLRYCQGLSAREMATRLGTSSEAAQKRVTRALDRLRDVFTRRGVTVGAAALGSLMTENAVQSAPIGLAGSLSAAALAGTASPGPLISALTKFIIMTTLQKAIVAAVILAAAAAAFYHLQASRAPVIARTTGLSLAISQPDHSPMTTPEKAPRQRSRSVRPLAPPTQIAQSPRSTAARPFTSTQFYQFLKTKAPVLSVAQLDAFLSFNQRVCWHCWLRSARRPTPLY